MCPICNCYIPYVAVSSMLELDAVVHKITWPNATITDDLTCTASAHNNNLAGYKRNACAAYVRCYIAYIAVLSMLKLYTVAHKIAWLKTQQIMLT